MTRCRLEWLKNPWKAYDSKVRGNGAVVYRIARFSHYCRIIKVNYLVM